jgi:hypothetical protein
VAFGTATVQVSNSFAGVIGGIQISVVERTLRNNVNRTSTIPTGVDVLVATGIVTSPNVIPSPFLGDAPEVSGAIENAALQNYNDAAMIQIVGVLNDGSRVQLGLDDGVSVTSTNTGVAVVASSAPLRALARGAGDGQLISAVWQGCGAVALATGSGSINVSVAAPGSATITGVPSTMTVTGDPMQIAGLAVQSLFQVHLVTTNGDGSTSRRDVTTSADTLFSVRSTNGNLLVCGSDASVLVCAGNATGFTRTLKTVAGTAFGAYNLDVSFLSNNRDCRDNHCHAA